MKELGINDADRVKYEHAHLCDMLQMAVSYDQRDVSSLGCFELLVRRLHMLEEAYGANPKAPRFDAQNHFMGQGRKSVAVAPALVAHVVGELRDEFGARHARRRPCATKSSLLVLTGRWALSGPLWPARNSACCGLTIARIC